MLSTQFLPMAHNQAHRSQTHPIMTKQFLQVQNLRSFHRQNRPPQVITGIADPAPEPFTAPPDPSKAPPSMRSRGRQRTVSSRTKESIEAGYFKSSIFNAFHSTYETQNNMDLDIQYRMSNPMEFLDETQGEMMYFHQSMDQEDSGDFVEAVVKEVNGKIDNAHWKLVPIE